MSKIYKINDSIRVRYQAVGAQTGIADLQMDVVDPNGDAVTGYPVTMAELSNGIYESSFSPDILGVWWVKITSVTNPENGFAGGYSVANYGSHEAIQNILVDSEGHEADISPNGRLKVSLEPPAPPVGTNEVIEVAYGNVSTSTDEDYLIPNGETLTLQRFSGGGEQAQSGSVIELWYDPNGNGVDMELIDAIFCTGSSDQHDLNQDFIGDGTKQIKMRRLRLSGGGVLLFGRWEGYY